MRTRSVRRYNREPSAALDDTAHTAGGAAAGTGDTAGASHCANVSGGSGSVRGPEGMAAPERSSGAKFSSTISSQQSSLLGLGAGAGSASSQSRAGWGSWQQQVSCCGKPSISQSMTVWACSGPAASSASNSQRMEDGRNFMSIGIAVRRPSVTTCVAPIHYDGARTGR